MKTTKITLIALLALAATGTVSAQTGDFTVTDNTAAVQEYRAAVDDALTELRGSVSYSLDGYDGADTDAQIAALKKQIEEAEHAVEKASVYRDALARGGKSTASEATNASNRVSEATWRLQSLQKRLRYVYRVAPLQKKVDVKFDNATVKQAAEALSKASGVRIRVDDDIPTETRLTVEARKIRLATVLESVARQAGLIIEPVNLDGNGDLGATLTVPPMLRVNDKVQRFSASSSPWSAAWGTPPTGRGLFGAMSPYIYFADDAGKLAEITRRATQIARAEVPRLFPAPRPTRPAGSSTRSLVQLPDGTQCELGYADKAVTVTLTEAGKNDKGETGVYRSTFTLKDGAFVRQSRVWSKK